LWYRGDRFGGFQSQPEQRTVELALVNAFAKIGEGISFSPAGRTYKGVHARMQVLSVRSGTDVREEHLFQGLARNLPSDVGVCSVVRCDKRFHAQWSAAGKEYRYRLDFRSPATQGPWKDFAWRVAEDPQLRSGSIKPEAVSQLLEFCQGTHDFFCFHAKSSVRKPRTLRKASLVEMPNGPFEIRLWGDSFARYQARFLVGSCVSAAAGLIAPEDFRAAVQRCVPIRGIRAPAKGLVLWETFYPEALDPFRAQRAAPPNVPSEAPFGFE
jgi:tRNA pseudouridine38-40 synthase